MNSITRFTRMSAIAGLVIVFVSFYWTSAALASSGKRVALVIGNSAYRNAVTLANPERDGRAVSEKLKKLGFIVVEGYDLDYRGMTQTVRDFSQAVTGADMGLFFYAGHGMQVGGKNYLVPVDAAFQDASALDFEAISVDLVMRQMQNNVGVRLFILDACRDNPLVQVLSRSLGGTSRSTSVDGGLAEVKIADAGEGTAIIFATSPGQVALDGEGGHSPFTTALIKYIETPGTDLQVVMSRITGEVYSQTKQQQRPWMNASLTGEVILNPVKTEPEQSVAAAEKPVPALQTNSFDDVLNRETLLYNVARDSGLIDDYMAYLEVFPNGLYAVNAAKQLERLKAEQQQKETVAVLPAENPAAANTEAPLQLPITDIVKAMPADATTEESLNLDMAKRQEIQVRLKLAGFDTGNPDGRFKNRSRTAIGDWQKSKGLAASGFLNQPQLEILSQQTETAFAAYVPPKSDVTQNTRKVSANKNTHPRRSSERVRQQNNDGAEIFGRIVGGVLGGMLRN